MSPQNVQQSAFFASVLSDTLAIAMRPIFFSFDLFSSPTILNTIPPHPVFCLLPSTRTISRSCSLSHQPTRQPTRKPDVYVRDDPLDRLRDAIELAVHGLNVRLALVEKQKRRRRDLRYSLALGKVDCLRHAVGLGDAYFDGPGRQAQGQAALDRVILAGREASKSVVDLGVPG